jgi:ATP synthase protein I
MDSSQPPSAPEPRGQQQAKPYLKYSGLAFQMIAVLVLSAWGGRTLDEKLNMKYPIWTMVLMLLGVLGTMYLVIRGVTRK